MKVVNIYENKMSHISCIYKKNYYFSHVSRCFSLFNEQLIMFVKKTNSSDLYSFLNQPDCINAIKQFPYEVLTTIIAMMHSTQVIKNKILYTHCEKVLHHLAIYCEPSELFLYFIEQMGLSNLDNCFFSLLSPIKTCLFRCKNPLLVIDMCIDIVKKFLLYLPLPSNMDCNRTSEILERIILSYINISNFVDNLFFDLQLLPFNTNINVLRKLKYLILGLLFSMFDKPISFLYFRYNNYELLFQKVLKNIFSIECDIFYFFRFINHNNFYKSVSSYDKRSNKSDENELLQNVNDLSFCNFYWTVLCNRLDIKIVKIYNPHYIAYNCINASNYLMIHKGEGDVTVMKGLELVSFALNTIKNFLIPLEALDLIIHNELVENLTHYIIYSNSTLIKKNALNNFIEYVHRFCNKAKYNIIDKIVTLDYHSKIKGIIIGIIKNIIADSLTKYKQTNINEENKIFLGQNLQLIISKICKLNQGNKTDLLEISDELIVILNFILFLIIRDKKNSGIIDYFEKTNYSFLKTIKSAITTQKTQWIMRLDNFTKNECINKLNDYEDIVINELKLMPVEKTIQICSQAINTLFIIENILFRIFEFIDIKIINL